MTLPAWKKSSRAASGAGRPARKTSWSPGKKLDPAFAILPDLLIVDGGKGQLGARLRVLERFDLSGRFRWSGLAKQQEELFHPGPQQLVDCCRGIRRGYI